MVFFDTNFERAFGNTEKDENEIVDNSITTTNKSGEEEESTSGFYNNNNNDMQSTTSGDYTHTDGTETRDARNEAERLYEQGVAMDGAYYNNDNENNSGGANQDIEIALVESAEFREQEDSAQDEEHEDEDPSTEVDDYTLLEDEEAVDNDLENGSGSESSHYDPTKIARESSDLYNQVGGVSSLLSCDYFDLAKGGGTTDAGDNNAYPSRSVAVANSVSFADPAEVRRSVFFGEDDQIPEEEDDDDEQLLEHDDIAIEVENMPPEENEDSINDKLPENAVDIAAIGARNGSLDFSYADVGIEIEEGPSLEQGVRSPRIFQTEDPEIDLALDDLGDGKDLDDMRIVKVVDKNNKENRCKSFCAARRRLCLLVCCMCCCLIILIIVLSIILTRDSSEDNTRSASSAAFAPTPPPASPVFALTAEPTSSSPVAPTPSPGPTAKPQLVLPESTWKTIWDSPTSPQAWAYSWFLTDMERMASTDFRSSLSMLQRFALATFYYATNGDSWTQNDGWLSMEHECNWFSSASRPDYEFSEISPCGPSGDVINNLILSNNNLTTTQLPPELFLLSNLQELDLQMNAIQGTLPADVANITSLRQLRIGRNQMNGSLPEEIGSMSELRVASLYTNEFSGTLPTSLANAIGLTELLLSANEFSGQLPSELALMPDLQFALLDENNFSGNIPTEWGSFSKILEIVLHENKLTGSLPSELGLLGGRLLNLDVRDNHITGLLPSEIGKLTNVRSLVLHENQIAGQLPSEIGNLVALENLYISSNILTGSIPESLGDCVELKIMWLNTNPMLSGPIPSELGKLRNVEDVFLSRCDLTGTVPPELGGMSSLRTLSLQQNPRLTGNIPSELAALEDLRKVTVTHTSMSGVIPEDVCRTLDTGFVFDCMATFCGCYGCSCPTTSRYSIP